MVGAIGVGGGWEIKVGGERLVRKWNTYSIGVVKNSFRY